MKKKKLTAGERIIVSARQALAFARGEEGTSAWFMCQATLM